MAKLSNKHAIKTRRVLVYGGPKTGKTELVGKLAEKYNLIFFDLENGYETLLKMPHDWQERVELLSIPDTKVFPIAIETMLKVIVGNPVEICEAHGKVGCQICKKEGAPTTRVCLNELTPSDIVVVDSLSQLSNSAMNHLTKNQEDTYKPEWTDYRNQGQLLDKFLSQVQQARFNIVCITHETEATMEDGRQKLVPVCGTREFSRNTAKYFDHVVYAELKNRKHVFGSSTTYAGGVLTGSRGDIALEKSDSPSLFAIFDGSGIGEEEARTAKVLESVASAVAVAAKEPEAGTKQRLSALANLVNARKDR